jgi:ubiquinone/menaquinone biosynthesis C-methylase UbiE
VYDRGGARYYDAIYGYKDYAGEAAHVDRLIRRHRRGPGRTLLDVACGTGKHIERLRRRYACEGLDLSPDMLAIARERLPDVPLHEGDMAAFDLGRRFDAVVCLFSAIGYMTSLRRLRRAIRAMARHLEPGGVLIVEPWFGPESWQVGHVSARFIDQPGFKLARMGVSQRRGRLTPLEEHHLVATPAGVEHFRHRHTLALYSDAEYQGAFQAAGLEPIWDDGLPTEPRGLYIGVRG